ncbi:ABC transporter ATP-binding protein [Syntrophomonas curvata]
MVELSKTESSETGMLAAIVAVGFFPELAIVVIVARIWLSGPQVLWVAVPYALLGLFLIYYFGRVIPRTSHQLSPEVLTLRHGYWFRFTIPRSNISSLQVYMGKARASFGVFRERAPGVLCVLSGHKNILHLALEEPVMAKGLFKNYGYIQEVVFNLDNPQFLMEELNLWRQEPREVLRPEQPAALFPSRSTDSAFSPASAPVLSLTEVSKQYNGVPAVESMSLELYAGELFGLLGSNGAGKTTTLKLISGLLKPTAGQIDAAGNTIAYMPEYTVPYERMSGREFLLFLSVLYDLDPVSSRRQVEEYLERFDLAAAADRVIDSYSQGMKRKICLIAALLKDSAIILLDEPTNGLDPGGIIQVKNIMRELTSRGKTVIFSTHILEMAERLCDRVGIIAGGRLIFTGSLEDLRRQTSMQEASLEEIFLRLVYGGQHDAASF